jgi:hypothetical protein
MAYDTDRVCMYRQVSAYTGQILNGAEPAELPVLQSTKQPANGQGSRPRSTSRPARPCRRGDQITARSLLRRMSPDLARNGHAGAA